MRTQDASAAGAFARYQAILKALLCLVKSFLSTILAKFCSNLGEFTYGSLPEMVWPTKGRPLARCKEQR
jgi:hypothetical protein